MPIWPKLFVWRGRAPLLSGTNGAYGRRWKIIVGGVPPMATNGHHSSKGLLPACHWYPLLLTLPCRRPFFSRCKTISEILNFVIKSCLTHSPPSWWCISPLTTRGDICLHFQLVFTRHIIKHSLHRPSQGLQLVKSYLWLIIRFWGGTTEEFLTHQKYLKKQSAILIRVKHKTQPAFCTFFCQRANLAIKLPPFFLCLYVSSAIS